MFENIIQLIVLFFVIFDPFASFMVFFTATKKMKFKQRFNTAMLAVLIAGVLSLMFLLFGEGVLMLFNTSIDNFRIAGGIILGILGIKMTLGHSLVNIEQNNGNYGKALASVIGTPLLTGPAAISAIIISSSEYGIIQTGFSISVVLIFTLLLLCGSGVVSRYIGKTTSQVISTILGLVTLAWAVDFIRIGLGF
ncbi:MAG: hypothetical protein KJ906_01825 [Nanoarchaeota archaeon]|nr:hypothetical protein [Nanoarchaeota archaeon]